MAIGLVSDEEYEREMAARKKVPSPKVVPSPEHGRKENDVNVPDALRKIIGEESVINGRRSALGLAEQFGISPSSVSAYAKGATSTASYHEPKASILQHLAKSRQRATKKASHVLNQALAAITQEKLDYTDAKELSGVAKDMSVIIRNLEPQQQNTNDTKQQNFVIYAPVFRQERDFDVIDVKE